MKEPKQYIDRNIDIYLALSPDIELFSRMDRTCKGEELRVIRESNPPLITATSHLRRDRDARGATVVAKAFPNNTVINNMYGIAWVNIIERRRWKMITRADRWLPSDCWLSTEPSK